MTTPARNNRQRRGYIAQHPGESALLSAALAMGILLMGIQLWILTVALEHFERHAYSQIYALAAISALIFAGGVVMLWLLRKKPSVSGMSLPASGFEAERH